MTRTIALVTIAALLLSGTALAQGGRAADRPNLGANLQTQAGPAMGPGGQGSLVAARLEGVVASVLGLTQDELHALKLDGATIADIAAERGTSLETLEATFIAARDGAVDELVAEGALSEQMAALLKARSPEAFASLIAREGALQGMNVDGTPLYAHRAAMMSPTGAAAARGAGHGARAAAQGAMHAPRGAGRYAAPTPAAAPRGMGTAQAGAAPRGMGTGQAGAGSSGAIAARVEGVVASTLGLTQDELHALKLDGATIADIAAERGIAVETLEAAFLTARAEAVQELLAEGTISELQADRMTARGPEAFADLLTRGVVAQGQNAGAAPRFVDRSAANLGPQAAQMTPRTTPRGGHGGRW